MFKSICLALALTMGIFSTASADTASTYRLNGTIRNLVQEYVNVPPILYNANIKVTIEAYPKSRYYKTEIKLLEPFNRVCNLSKTLEVWDDKQLVRSTVNVDLNLRCGLLKRIIEPRIERAILNAEKNFLNSKLDK